LLNQIPFKLYNDQDDINLYSCEVIINNSEQEIKKPYNKYNIEDNVQGSDNQQNHSLNYTIPPVLEKKEIKSIRLENNILSIRYNEHNLEIPIDILDYDRISKCVKFECQKYSINNEIQNMESFISDIWNLILTSFDFNKLPNLLNHGISDLFDTPIKMRLKEYES